ncbi:hypothetical protein [uncultured Thiodictyon sp.]|uniref:hypothetical protein n=1 Tax=uncultured Thiodictyon sp. TaxID=1846217 RepID=UPI0025D6E191|nr:hypothetical protein [uncultured Thiodictyon sp.]
MKAQTQLTNEERQPCEVWSRGKQSEHRDRLSFREQPRCVVTPAWPAAVAGAS